MTVDISNDLLFPVVETLSPRLAWMRRNGLTTFRSSPISVGATSPETGDVIQSWNAARVGKEQGMIQGPVCTAATEEAALAELAVKLQLRLWNEESAT